MSSLPFPSKKGSMIVRDPMNGNWISGYTQALIDVQRQFAGVIHDLNRSHKRLSAKHIDRMLELHVANRSRLRKDLGFIRYNRTKEDLEYYLPPEERYEDEN